MKNQSASLKKVALVTLLGGAMEWYCFLLYGQAVGTVFNKVFFSGVSDPYSAHILSYISFAIGYLARPFGVMFFGNYGDKLGRKFTVIASLGFMGVSTFAIGWIPSYDKIGVAAPILLQVFRLTQCFGMGGKWGGGILMAFENADPKERAFYAAIPQMGLPVGLALASFLLAVPSYFRPESAFLNYWKILLLGIGTRWIDGVFYNVFAVFTLSYATQQLGVSQSVMYGINIIFALVSMPFVLKRRCVIREFHSYTMRKAFWWQELYLPCVPTSSKSVMAALW